MDFLEILFLLLFVLLPLLQGVLTKQKPPSRPLPPPEETPEGERELTALETMRLPPFPGQQPGGWGGSWPGESFPAEEAEEVVEADEGELFPERAHREDLAPEVERVASPVVSLEPVFVDHEVDHRRQRVRFAAPERVPPPPARPSAAARLAGDLSRGEIRRAIILSEVLGPPLAMRDPDARQDARR